MSKEIEQVELSIEQAKLLADRKNQLNKLFSNREFKKVILEGYFESEAKRLVALSGEGQMVEQRDEIFLEIQAIAKLQQYFRTVTMLGNMAEQEMAEGQEILDELREEAA